MQEEGSSLQVFSAIPTCQTGKFSLLSCNFCFDSMPEPWVFLRMRKLGFHELQSC